MKKLLVLVLVFVVNSTYSQNNTIFKKIENYFIKNDIHFDDDNVGSISFLKSAKTYMSLEMKASKFGGIGNDWYDDKVTYDESFFKMANGNYNPKILNNKRESMGLFYVSPSYKRFDVIVGFGTIKYFIYDTWQTGDYVNGYTRSNGTYVNGYYRNVRNVSGYNEVDKTNFLLFGVSKSIRIYPNKETEHLNGEGVYLHIRGVVRNLPKYGNEELGRILKPQLQLGIKMQL